MIAGEEGHAAKIDADVAFPDSFTCGAYRNRGKRLDADIQLFQVVYLTHRAVDDQPFPFILRSQTRQFGVDQRATDRTTAIDQQNATTAILFEQIVEQPVVLETFYRDDLSAKRRPSSKVREQWFHDVDIFLVDVTKLGSIVFHRLNVQLLREFLVYRAMRTVCKIINCSLIFVS
ncbi:hypothetical protein CKO_03066 [Citrobacter koseri ATCC BAA-895]|uniref:Uncharacterized protein n=1 Tax=Citrobacter koseri (strain ATCC BAA-895 / CDC 4225-83 / SGSC4696) TaxID=290338 RepID=A8AKZ3_CITK8|nr:hypothetical protein CKO_03066 [Citrobacter koseri ATCC BAA-895]